MRPATASRQPALRNGTICRLGRGVSRPPDSSTGAEHASSSSRGGGEGVRPPRSRPEMTVDRRAVARGDRETDPSSSRSR
ncbi:hypothetical protein ACRAWF_06875 [Streptomyces sp. L7]